MSNFFLELRKINERQQRIEILKEKEKSEEGKNIVKKVDEVIGSMLLEDGFKYNFPYSFFKAIGFALAEKGIPITKHNINEVLQELLSPADLSISEVVEYLDKEGYFQEEVENNQID